MNSGGGDVLKYPVSVFLDTNIFISCRYDFNENVSLYLLKKYASDNKVKIYISNIVYREVEKHIRFDVLQAIRSFKKAQEEASKALSQNILLNFSSLLSKKGRKEQKEKVTDLIIKMFRDFLKDSGAMDLDNNGVNIEEILDNYFDSKPPFEEKQEKKYEFPDAIIISKLKNQFSKENPIHIISNDKGFKSAFNKADGFYLYSSLKEFFNSLNISSKFYNKIKKYLELEETHDEVCEILKEKIEEGIFVDGMDYDAKGITEGFDYDEIYIEDVSNISFEFEFVDVIKENKISVTLSCKADISVNCSYLDTDNSVWDSEEKRYIYESHGQVLEKHSPDFDCTATFSINQNENTDKFSLMDISFDFVLDQDTRTSREILGNDVE